MDTVVPENETAASLPILFMSVGIFSLVVNLASASVKLSACRKSHSHSRISTAGLGSEYKICLSFLDFVFILVSLSCVLGSVERYLTVNITDDSGLTLSNLCQVSGFAILMSMLLLSWTPLTLSVVLFESEKYHDARIRASKGLNFQMAAVIQVSILVTSIILVLINYLPLPETDTNRCAFLFYSPLNSLIK